MARSDPHYAFLHDRTNTDTTQGPPCAEGLRTPVPSRPVMEGHETALMAQDADQGLLPGSGGSNRMKDEQSSVPPFLSKLYEILSNRALNQYISWCAAPGARPGPASRVHLIP